MSDDEGLRCATIRAQTRARLLELGVPDPPPFLVIVERADGGEIPIHVATVVRLGEMVREMHPSLFKLSFGPGDDGDNVTRELDAILNDEDVSEFAGRLVTLFNQ